VSVKNDIRWFEGVNPRFRLLITILVGTKINFEVAENEQLQGGHMCPGR
jgi:hypothetical protein